jgi:hypothetical protein
MHKLLLVPFAMGLALQANATCRQDTVEMGDTGPDDPIVCATLKSINPNSDIRIINRYIHSADRVNLAIVKDGKPLQLEYKFEDFQWLLKNNSLLANQ